jgi:hypothetical protein
MLFHIVYISKLYTQVSLLCSCEFHCLLCCVLLMSFTPSLLCITSLLCIASELHCLLVVNFIISLLYVISLLQVAFHPCYALLVSFITPSFCVTSLSCARGMFLHLFFKYHSNPLMVFFVTFLLYTLDVLLNFMLFLFKLLPLPPCPFN